MLVMSFIKADGHVFVFVKMHPLIPGSFEFAQTMADGGVFTNSSIKV